MKIYWVVSTKVRVAPKSSLPQDASSYYYGRSIVPCDTREQAIDSLTSTLKDDFMEIEEVIDIVTYDSKAWVSDEDDNFEINDSFDEASRTGNIALGCFLSELSLED